MKITENVSFYDAQGEDNSEEEIEIQPGDPGKNSVLPVMAITHCSRLWQVTLLENF
jgi:hypothetical protein